jgi:hypothetical protein
VSNLGFYLSCSDPDYAGPTVLDPQKGGPATHVSAVVLMLAVVTTACTSTKVHACVVTSS